MTLADSRTPLSFRPQISFDDAEAQRAVDAGVSVVRSDGAPLNPYDVKRLQVGLSRPSVYSCRW